MRKEDDPIVVEQSFNATTEAVWNAITEIDQMHRWYFDNIPDCKPEVGFETQFSIQNKNRVFLHMWKVIEVILNKRLVYNWKYDSYASDSNVIFEIFEQNNLTTLRLTTQILESFPQDIPEFKRESCDKGWKYFIQNNLKGYLENIS
jgi:uncharacterized protein YndB with AHSA1/START domain